MASLFKGPAYRIHTQRLVIRCYNPADAPLLKAAIDESLEHLLPWMPWARNEPQTLQQKIELLRRMRGEFDLGTSFVYGIFNQDETRVLGGTGLHPRIGFGALEIGYWVHKDFINQGIATECAAALTKVGFEVEGLRRMEIHCDARNDRSAAVPRKLGYTHEATLRQHNHFYDEIFVDSMIWTLLREDYPQSPAAAAEVEAFDAMNRRIL